MLAEGASDGAGMNGPVKFYIVTAATKQHRTRRSKQSRVILGLLVISKMLWLFSN